MASNDEVLKSFLVSLGFRIDDTAFRRFKDGMASIDSTAMLVGKTVAGVAVAAEAMVQVFSNQMEKLYYSSQRTKASVSNIQALEYGFTTAGLSADSARQSLEGLAAAMRMNPAKQGLLDRILGKSSAGMDPSRQVLELVKALSKLPHFQGAAFANMFGMDEQTFLMIKNNLPQIERSMELRNRLLKESGMDARVAAYNAKEYANALREIWERVEVVSAAMANELLPTFQKFAKWINDTASAVNNWKASSTDAKEYAGQLGEVALHLGEIKARLDDIFSSKAMQQAGTIFGGAFLATWHAALDIVNAILLLLEGRVVEAAQKVMSAVKRAQVAAPQSMTGDPYNQAGRTSGGAIGGGTTVSPLGSGSLTGEVEAGSRERFEYNLAELKATLARAKNATAVKALTEELNRIQTPASQELLNQAFAYRGYAPSGSAGSTGSAAAAGSGGVTISQKTDIHVSGSSDPTATAQAVAGAQRGVNAEIVRNAKGAAR